METSGISEIINGLLVIVPQIIAAASVVTAATSTPKQGTVMSKLYRIIEILGLVVGRAKQEGR